MLLEREGQERSDWRPDWTSSHLGLTSANPGLGDAETEADTRPGATWSERSWEVICVNLEQLL